MATWPLAIKAATAGIVVNDGQVPWPEINQRVNQFDWTARFAKAPNHDGGAIGDVADRVLRSIVRLLDHSGVMSQKIEFTTLF